MTNLHFQPIRGNSLEIIKTILHDQELALLSEALFCKLYVVLDELVSNIVKYAYPDNDNGYLDIEMIADKDLVTLRFRDGGIPFNPLEKEHPDITLPMSQRTAGGLGILFVIHKAHSIAYEYLDGENVLTISLK